MLLLKGKSSSLNYQSNKGQEKKSSIQNMTNSSKISVKGFSGEEHDKSTVSTPSVDESKGENDLWGEAFSFYSLPEDLADFEEMSCFEDVIQMDLAFKHDKEGA